MIARENCRIGMKVTFGRRTGERTLGQIVKLNAKKAKVKTFEDRGQRHQAGEEWGVPYSMLYPVDGQPDTDVPLQADQPIEFSLFQNAVDVQVLTAINYIYADLSPENLSCDGELSGPALRRKYDELMRKLRGLFKVLGREVSETVACNWYEQRQKSLKQVD